MTKNSDLRPNTLAWQLEMARQDTCCSRPCLVDRAHSWKQILILTTCIMGVLAALSVALVAILKVTQG